MQLLAGNVLHSSYEPGNSRNDS